MNTYPWKGMGRAGRIGAQFAEQQAMSPVAQG